MKAVVEHGFLVDSGCKFTPATVTVRTEKSPDLCTMSLAVDTAGQMILVPLSDKVIKLLKEVIK